MCMYVIRKSMTYQPACAIICMTAIYSGNRKEFLAKSDWSLDLLVLDTHSDKKSNLSEISLKSLTATNFTAGVGASAQEDAVPSPSRIQAATTGTNSSSSSDAGIIGYKSIDNSFLQGMPT